MNKQKGYLEVITGPMFSGKTEEMIRQLKRAAIGKKPVQVFKHTIDTRYGKDKKLYSHAGITFSSELVTDAKDILKRLSPMSHIVAIDEAQWFGRDVINVVNELVSQGKHVIVSGLALTFDRQPFHPIPSLMAMADKVTKLTAVCSICGEDAVFHKRITQSNKKVSSLKADPKFVGKSALEYQPRCRECFDKP
jgi:thymidine kinase